MCIFENSLKTRPKIPKAALNESYCRAFRVLLALFLIRGFTHTTLRVTLRCSGLDGCPSPRVSPVRQTRKFRKGISENSWNFRKFVVLQGFSSFSPFLVDCGSQGHPGLYGAQTSSASRESVKILGRDSDSTPLMSEMLTEHHGTFGNGLEVIEPTLPA